MGKRWITIDCILPVLEMMDDCSHGIDLWKGLHWSCMGYYRATHNEDADRNKVCTLHAIQIFQLFCSYPSLGL